MEHLIPQAWFVDLSQSVLLLILGIAVYVLIKGADWLVDGASGLAYRFHIPKVIVGATIVSMGTTSPECAVSVMAAWSGQPGLALGNAVGSIIADTALIFGIGCLLTRLPADRFVLNRQGWVQLASGLLLALLCYGAFMLQGDRATLGRSVGLVMLGLLAVYIVISIRWSRRHIFGEPFQTPDTVTGAPVTPSPDETQDRHTPLYLLGLLLIGLCLVIISSRVLIGSVTVLAERWGVPEVVLAATIVALGTSLPELVVGITSIAKGHKELLVGNVIGADILNVLFVVGASATAARLPIVDNGQRIFLYLHLPAMLTVLVIFRLMIVTAIRRGGFARWNGFPLVLIYVIYVVSQFLISRG